MLDVKPNPLSLWSYKLQQLHLICRLSNFVVLYFKFFVECSWSATHIYLTCLLIVYSVFTSLVKKVLSTSPNTTTNGGRETETGSPKSPQACNDRTIILCAQPNVCCSALLCYLWHFRRMPLAATHLYLTWLRIVYSVCTPLVETVLSASPAITTNDWQNTKQTPKDTQPIPPLPPPRLHSCT